MFDFPLQKVLDYRNCLLKKAELKFAEELRILIEEEKNLLHKKGERIKYVKSLEESEKKDFEISLISYFITYLHFLEKEILFRQKKVENAKISVEEARSFLIKAKKDKEILEKLKEQMWKDFINQEIEKEQKIADDVSTIRFIREKSGLGFLNLNIQ